MRPTAAGLVVAGEVDRSTDEGRQVWRSIKSGVCGFSIGFMSESQPRPGGGRVLTEVDLIEVSATSTPMHPSTRALSWKTALDVDVPTEADQRRRLARLMPCDQASDRDLAAIKAAWDDNRHLLGTSKPRVKSTAPIRIASFEC
jgi:hypothetical protein